MTAGPNTLILGIGNVLWADEGFGVRAVEELARRHRFGPNVRLLDGGTQGIYLVDQVRWAQVLVVFDAVDYGLAPGTLKRVEGDEVPRFLGVKKMSLHQTGFQEVLALAALLGDYPRHLLLVGVQPVELDDFGGSLRPQVRAQMDPAIDLALDYLAGLGIRPLPGAPGSAAGSDLPHPSLGLARYEAERPSAAEACRLGDARVLARVSARALAAGA
jgi:hydrogenase maturation protease